LLRKLEKLMLKQRSGDTKTRKETRKRSLKEVIAEVETDTLGEVASRKKKGPPGAAVVGGKMELWLSQPILRNVVAQPILPGD
jgi:putative aminopeptidase FrvX